ncbi:MAG: helix-turn-helix domain-containing protein [Acetobacteraceae bacterium]
MATVRVTPAMIDRTVAETDWAGIDVQTDEEIARNVAGDPDAAPLLTDAETAAALVRTVRLRLGLSQAGFAQRFQVPIGTLRDWEQGRRQPDATALAYLRVIAGAPEVVAQVLAA